MAIFIRGNSSEIGLETKLMRKIPNEQFPKRPKLAMEIAEKLILSKNPNYKTRRLNGTYNCIGLIFSSRRTGIDPMYFDIIASDDGYRMVSNISDVLPGDIAVYSLIKTGKVEHIGLIVSKAINLNTGHTNITVLSQIGRDGEYFHDHDDYPKGIIEIVGDLDCKFWTEREL